MPIPTRVQRLLKSLLTETPDRPMANRGKRDPDVEKLESAGFDVDALMNVNWSAEDAVTFAIDARYHVVMWLANNSEERAYQHMDFDDFFTGGYRDAKVSKGVVGMDWSKYRMLAKWHAGKFSSGERTTSTLMMGRLWRKTGFVSFWNKKTDVMKEWSLVLDFITNMQLNPKKCAYEFIDVMDIELYDEVVGKTTSGSKDVDPEVLRQMHTSPDLKKAILGTDTGKKKSAMDGYYSHVGDGIIKLGDLLAESPDGLDIVPNIEQTKRMKSLGIDVARVVNRAGWHHDDDDAVPFAYDTQGNVILFSVNDSDGNRSSPIHDDLFTTISIYVEHSDLFELKKMAYGWTIIPKWNEDGWEELVSPDDDICPVTFGGMNGEEKIRHYVEEVADVLGAPGRANKRYVLGRFWSKIPLVSFWSSMQQFHSRNAAPAVDLMLKVVGVSPDKAIYEFSDNEDRYFFYDELEKPAVSTMSAAEYKEKLAKQHLDPQAKRDLNKDVEHPDKYGGILPAQYHAWSRTSDGIIKLGDLLKEDPDEVAVIPDRNDVVKMKKLGINAQPLMKKSLEVSSKDAVTFMYDLTTETVVCGTKAGSYFIHEDLLYTMFGVTENRSNYKVEKMQNSWKLTQTHTIRKTTPTAAAERVVLNKPNVLIFIGPKTEHDVFSYISGVISTVKRMPGRGGNRFIQGRFWKKVPVVSFWSRMKTATTPTNLQLTTEMLRTYEIDPTKTVFEFIDQEDQLFFWDELTSPKPSSVGKDEYLEKLKKQHLDPRVKRDLNKDVEHPDKYGGILPAQYHAWSRTSDGIIKLGDLLK